MNWRNRVEISYGALHHNVRAVRAVVGDRDLIAVVKADAYGLGVQRCARIYIEAGAAGVAVATVGEARQVAAAVPGARIMLLGSPLPDERQGVVEGGFEVWVSSKEEILDFAHLGHPERPARLHLAVDTGMGRAGCSPREAAALINVIDSQSDCVLAGLATHYPEALDPHGSAIQEGLFEDLCKALGPRDPSVWIHRANSEGIMERPLPPCNAVRAGLLLTGVEEPQISGQPLRSAIRWVSAISLVKQLPQGHTVSYNKTVTLQRDSTIALVPVGYADGYPFQCSNRGAVVLVAGQRCPILGRVTMDYLILDVSDVPHQPVLGDQVVLLGTQGDESISVSELASWAQSIPYDILCGFRGRCEILGVP